MKRRVHASCGLHALCTPAHVLFSKPHLLLGLDLGPCPSEAYREGGPFRIGGSNACGNCGYLHASRSPLLDRRRLHGQRHVSLHRAVKDPVF